MCCEGLVSRLYKYIKPENPQTSAQCKFLLWLFWSVLQIGKASNPWTTCGFISFFLLGVVGSWKPIMVTFSWSPLRSFPARTHLLWVQQFDRHRFLPFPPKTTLPPCPRLGVSIRSGEPQWSGGGEGRCQAVMARGRRDGAMMPDRADRAVRHVWVRD